MSIKDMMFDEKFEGAASLYTKMLKLLDSKGRARFNNQEKLLEGAGIKPGQTVLEIGCGSGFFTLPASRILGKSNIIGRSALQLRNYKRHYEAVTKGNILYMIFIFDITDIEST